MGKLEEKKGKYNKLLYTREAKIDRFNRIVNRRVNKIADLYRMLGNTSNKTLYKYTDKHINKIFDFLEKQLKETKNRFNIKNENNFKL